MRLGAVTHATHAPLGIKVYAKALYISDKVHAICQGSRGGFHLLGFVLCCHVRPPYLNENEHQSIGYVSRPQK
jgi:hypothetical protein